MVLQGTIINSLAPGWYGCNLIKVLIFEGKSVKDILSISCAIVLRWMSQDMTDD